MKNIVRIIAVLFIFSHFTISTLKAQAYDKLEGGGKPDPQLSQKDNDYLDRQAKVFLDTIRSILIKYKPAIPENPERGMAKLLMDAVFHDHYAAYRKPVQVFFHTGTDSLIKELETTKIENGATIWKVYNMGFIVRTKSVTLAFDLARGETSGSPDFTLSAEETDRIVRQCDILIISHKHIDHADRVVAENFLQYGKPVITPDQVWKNEPIFTHIIHPERIAEKKQNITLSKNRILELINYPGHQLKSAENNVSLVKTPEGITIVHTGDQINEGDFMMDFKWIDKVSENHKVDILIPNAWTTDILRIVKGFNPAVVLPGHEIELGHTVWDRLPFWGDDKYLELNYAELKKSRYPVVVLVWSESYHYSPAN